MSDPSLAGISEIGQSLLHGCLAGDWRGIRAIGRRTIAERLRPVGAHVRVVRVAGRRALFSQRHHVDLGGEVSSADNEQILVIAKMESEKGESRLRL